NLPGKAGTPENDPIENFTKLAIPFLEIDEREALEPISLRVKGSSDNREKKMRATSPYTTNYPPATVCTGHRFSREIMRVTLKFLDLVILVLLDCLRRISSKSHNSITQLLGNEPDSAKRV
ncbi:5356_t:CDS:2, partial [Gigaspora rosea]